MPAARRNYRKSRKVSRKNRRVTRRMRKQMGGACPAKCSGNKNGTSHHPNMSQTSCRLCGCTY